MSKHTSTLLTLTSLIALSPLGAAKVPLSCEATSSPYKATVRHIEGKGIGYNQGYTSVDLFIAPPPTLPHNFLPFLDTRLHVFDNGRIATNVGVGVRYIASSCVYGINSYYDYRETSRQKYNQYSLGFEALGNVWDFRLNGYLPVGDKRSSFYNTTFGYFSGYTMHLKTSQDMSMAGLNTEAGIHINPMKHIQLYGAFGPYYFGKAGQNAIGGKVRFSATFLDYITLEASTSYDPVFHWTGQGELSFTIPFGPKKNLSSTTHCSKSQRLRKRALQSINRQEIIVINNKNYYPLAINPATHLPWGLIFVDNTSHSLGSFESPFPTLLEAQNTATTNNIIYVYPGDGTDTGMNRGITLQPGQKLFGASISHPIATTFGTITISPHSADRPLITNTNGSTAIITLSDNCEVAGLNLTTNNTLSFGILGGTIVLSSLPILTTTVQSPFLRENIVNTPNVSQAAIGLSTMNAILLNNQAHTEASLSNSVGIFVGSPTSLTATLVGNTGTGTGAGASGIFLSAGSITGSILTGNNGTGTGADASGIFLSANSSITGSLLTSNDGKGIGNTATGICLLANSITANTLTSNNGTGIGQDAPGIFLSANSSITDTTLTGNIGTGSFGIFLSTSSSIAGATLTGNVGTGGAYGIALQAHPTHDNQTCVTLIDNTGKPNIILQNHGAINDFILNLPASQGNNTIPFDDTGNGFIEASCGN